MTAQVLATKLYVPLPRQGAVPRPRLLARLDDGLPQNLVFQRKLTLISAPAGFGKTALLAEWLAAFDQCRSPVRAAWLSLDEGDGEPTRFLTYVAAALQTVAPGLGASILAALETSQPPPAESLLTPLLNELAAVSYPCVLVLDDYHLVNSEQVDRLVAFLVEHLPPRLHLVVATREDPQLPLARLRARGQLAELRASDLRFTPGEAAQFLNQVMALNLAPSEVAALADRTEGWIAGLQLAALALQSPSTSGASPLAASSDAAGFINAFTGSHRFVLDYLLEEVLERQPAGVQTFLLHTSILDRMCGPLCEAVVFGDAVPAAPNSGQAMLEHLERANLFVVPLDGERRWYRYHHLFSSLLRQRLGQKLAPGEIDQLRIRASQWYEDHGLLLDAFQHAGAAHDLERAERLIEDPAMGLHYRSVALSVLDWLDGLPDHALDARPLLRVRSATVSLMAGRSSGVAEKLVAAERSLQDAEQDAYTRDLVGQLACARATLAVTRYDLPTMRAQALVALAHLRPENASYRFTANWALASACQLSGDRAGAAAACRDAVAAAERASSIFSRILATTLLGNVQQVDLRLHEAAASYRRALALAGEHPHPNIGAAHLNLAQIHYEWNDLELAAHHGELSLQMLRQFDLRIDRFVLSEVFLARLKLARGDPAGAAVLLAQTEEAARRRNFLLRLPEVAAAQVLVYLRLGDTAAAAELTRQYDLPLSQARVHLAQRQPSAALALLERQRQDMEARGWVDERLKVQVLQAIALHASGEQAAALQVLRDALAGAEGGGLVRLFLDEGPPMAELLSAAVGPARGSAYAGKLLQAFEAQKTGGAAEAVPAGSLLEPLTPRELEVLHLISEGLSNQEIGARLFLALDTVKGHNRRIFDKLQVQRRTEAAARARELGLL